MSKEIFSKIWNFQNVKRICQLGIFKMSEFSGLKCPRICQLGILKISKKNLGFGIFQNDQRFDFCKKKNELVKSEYFRWFYDPIRSLVKKFKNFFFH